MYYNFKSYKKKKKCNNNNNNRPKHNIKLTEKNECNSIRGVFFQRDTLSNQ